MPTRLHRQISKCERPLDRVHTNAWFCSFPLRYACVVYIPAHLLFSETVNLPVLFAIFCTKYPSCVTIKTEISWTTLRRMNTNECILYAIMFSLQTQNKDILYILYVHRPRKCK